MHIRTTPGGAIFVSIREENHQAVLRIGNTQVALGPLEVPWHTGLIGNGSILFHLKDPPPPAWSVQPPIELTDYCVATTHECVVVTRDQANLAVVAANLFSGEGLDPIEGWAERLKEHLRQENQHPEVRISLIAAAPAGVVFAGSLIAELGAGRAEDSIPGTTISTASPDETPAGADIENWGRAPLAPWQRRLWIPTTQREDRWRTGSFRIDLPHATGFKRGFGDVEL